MTAVDSANKAKARAAFLDFLRILAAFLVIVNHTNSHVFKALTPVDSQWHLSILWYYLSKTAVPLFIMISGACLLGKRDSYAKTGRRILRTLLALVLASYLYFLWDAWVNYGLWPRAVDFGALFGKIWRGEITDGFWYLPLYLGLLLTLLWGAVAALGLWMLALLRQYSAEAPTAMAAGAAYYVALILPLGAACWVFPILSRCAMSFGALNKTALKFSAGHLPSTVVLVLMTAEIARLSVRWLFPLAFMPAVLMLLWSLFIEPAFKKHGAGIAAETEQENTEDAADASEKE